MNFFSFLGLMKSIYAKNKLPDLQRIQAKGLLAVKIAQHYALRIDFLDAGVCRHLAGLLRAADPAEGRDFEQICSNSRDERWLANFKSISKRPFAAASVGQLHRAELLDGTQVVIKVIKQDFKESFSADLARLRRYLKIILGVAPILKKVFNPLAILEHIEQYTLSELDLRNEIDGAGRLEATRQRYLELYAPLQRLRFVRHYPELSGANVLVADYIPGATLDTLLDSKQLSYPLLLELFSMHGLFLFAAGEFHGDLHPGNVIIAEDAQVYFIDTAAVSCATRELRLGLFRFFVELCRKDYAGAAAALHGMSRVSLNEQQYAAFYQKFTTLYADFAGKNVSELSLTRQMMETIKLGVYSGMSFDEGMFAIIKSLMYLDGMVLRCNPQSVLLDDMQPLVEDFQSIIHAQLPTRASSASD